MLVLGNLNEGANLVAVELMALPLHYRNQLVLFIHRYSCHPELLNHPGIRRHVGTYLRHSVLTLLRRQSNWQQQLIRSSEHLLVRQSDGNPAIPHTPFKPRAQLATPRALRH